MFIEIFSHHQVHVVIALLPLTDENIHDYYYYYYETLSCETIIWMGVCAYGGVWVESESESVIIIVYYICGGIDNA
jgi:hypothetical protein